jgi:O-antigen/teichoic acid export membrane protein
MTLVGIYQAFNYFLTREKAFTGSAINRITQKVGEGATNLASGYSGIHSGLIMGDLTGRASVAVMAYFQGVKAGFQSKDIVWEEMKLLAKRYWEFAVIGTGPALLDSISLNLPIFFISSFFDKASTGQFYFSRTFLAIPLSIISANIAQVLLQRISEQRNAGKPVMHEIRKIFLMLLAASVSLAIILQFTAPWIFSTIFGKAWLIAGKYSAILAIAFAARFAISPMNVVFTAYEKVRAFSLWQVFYAVLIAFMYFTSTPQHGTISMGLYPNRSDFLQHLPVAGIPNLERGESRINTRYNLMQPVGCV